MGSFGASSCMRRAGHMHERLRLHIMHKTLDYNELAILGYADTADGHASVFRQAILVYLSSGVPWL